MNRAEGKLIEIYRTSTEERSARYSSHITSARCRKDRARDVVSDLKLARCKQGGTGSIDTNCGGRRRIGQPCTKRSRDYRPCNFNID